MSPEFERLVEVARERCRKSVDVLHDPDEAQLARTARERDLMIVDCFAEYLPSWDDHGPLALGQCNHDRADTSVHYYGSSFADESEKLLVGKEVDALSPRGTDRRRPMLNYNAFVDA